MKVINTLADTFKLNYHVLLKLKKYEGLVYNEEQEIGGSIEFKIHLKI